MDDAAGGAGVGADAGDAAVAAADWEELGQAAEAAAAAADDDDSEHPVGRHRDQ